MEIYKDLSNPASQEFEKLLNSQVSKVQIEEGKIIEGKINKITEKFVFLYVENLKSEPVLDVNELRQMGLGEKIKVGETIKVLLERIEDKNGEVLVSASKAHKIAGWEKLIEAYEKNEPIMGKITSKCKGGAIVEHIRGMVYPAVAQFLKVCENVKLPVNRKKAPKAAETLHLCSLNNVSYLVTRY